MLFLDAVESRIEELHYELQCKQQTAADLETVLPWLEAAEAEVIEQGREAIATQIELTTSLISGYSELLVPLALKFQVAAHSGAELSAMDLKVLIQLND